MTVGLLLCDHVSPRYREAAGDYPEMFADLFGRQAPALRLTSFDACRGVLPEHVDVCEAYVCTGSRFSCTDDADWIHALKGFVRRLHDARKPFVGICFGHQVLADALGGQVARAAQGWGAGVSGIDVVRREDWMRPERQVVRLQYMHQDQVIRLPDTADTLGRSAHCPVAVFRVGSMLGIQAHPEFRHAFCEALIRDRIDQIGSERAQQALASLDDPTDEDVVAAWIKEFLGAGKV